MAQGHCGHASQTAARAQYVNAPAVSAVHDGQCRHSAEPAVETEVFNHHQYASASLPIVAMLRSASALHGTRPIRETSSALRPPHFDPLLAELRV